ncbi:MAG: dTDP-4-dehydrorhamnose reductase [Pseudomonadota bacterium]
MNILIAGAKGQLGSELMRQGPDRGFSAFPVDLPEVDITSPDPVRAAIRDTGASLVINCAAYTQVDMAESQDMLAFKVNSLGPAILAHVCSEAKIPLIHISTDFVFDGSKRSPYLETDPVSPMSVYGKSKAAGEAVVERILSRHIILRTAWLYALQGQNFVRTILRLGAEMDTVRVVSDQLGCPTCAEDLAESLLTLSEAIRAQGEIAWGTYHYCGKGVISWHEFAQAILDIAKAYIPLKTTRVDPITTDQYPTPAKRPVYSALNCEKIQSRFGIYPKPWRESLEKTLSRMLAAP